MQKSVTCMNGIISSGLNRFVLVSFPYFLCLCSVPQIKPTLSTFSER